MKKSKMKKVERITVDKEGNTIINLVANLADDDWIRAGRLLAQGKVEEYHRMQNTPLYVEDEEE